MFNYFTISYLDNNNAQLFQNQNFKVIIIKNILNNIQILK